MRTLTRIVARLAERHVATSAWLFLVQGKARLLVADVTHNTDRCGLTRELNANGVVPHVAREKAPLLVPDVSTCPFYENTVKSTKSEVAVPITLSATGELLGVLNLESDRVGKFTQNTLNDLKEQVGELVLHILCLRSMEAGDVVHWPWHPARHGWGLGEILEDICHAISKALSPNAPNAVTATIWCADWDKRVLYVRGTNGYDYDFISDRMLPFESFTGEVVQRPPGDVVYENPDYPNFVEWEKAHDMGLTNIISVPVYREEKGKVTRRAIGVLNIYYLNGIRVVSLPSRNEMQQVAELVGRVLRNLMSLRVSVACSYLEARLRGDKASAFEGMSFWDMHGKTICQVFSDCLVAEGCTVFAIDDRKRELVGIETTGVRPTIAMGDEEYTLVRFGNREFPRFKLDSKEDEGILTFLVDNVGNAVRKHHILDLNEEGVPDHLPKRIVQRHFERLSNDTDDRRFLGIGIDSSSGPLGVIRLVRSANSPPFTKADELLLTAMTQVVARTFDSMLTDHCVGAVSSTRVYKAIV